MSRPFDLLEEARAAAADPDRLRAIATTSLSASLPPLDLVNIGIVLRDAGLREEALSVFDRLACAEPRDIPSRYEKAILYLHEGSHSDALLTLQEILAHHPHEDRTNLVAARILYSLGETAAGDAAIDRIPILGHPDRHAIETTARVIREFGLFVADYPRERALAMATALSSSPRYLSAHGVTAAAAAALDAGTGFSLIRVGDGEGAFVRLSDSDERRFPNLYLHNRRDRAHVWFAGTVDIQDDGFLATACRISDLMRDADIVGMPYPDWIRHEYKLLSVTGISALVNLLRVDRPPHAASCSQLISLELHESKALYHLMRQQDSIGLIACHHDLPEILKAEFGFSEIDYHHVPGEKGHSHLLAAASVEGTHWPDRFLAIMEALSRPLNGKLYLVAAGLLGKLYCHRIKQSGGVALDIGSLADGWMGVNTRPGLRKLSFA
ncbi:tetratricopeptide repeat protein [Methylobacterium nodulans]|uniref:Methyltransferase type 11 n=1 Tax=Methylobacterium nodulans (strain LMG 21967 / CNCM I-2342 / ORS 2060) TaxID=460265 RepID=B8IV69_METNO|nr:tetratricopeptide repeat protein [Methylobacterium nodulans]ACL60920.1 methyltransferase type 11 [Methylobacterium nodulans ORS 2060]